jgi:hypothetical protein
MRRVAKALIKEDVDGDGTIGWQDIVSFHPLTDQSKSRMPWGYVVEDIDRKMQGYDADLDVRYGKWYDLEDPPILQASFTIHSWDTASEVNSLVRGENYYEPAHAAYHEIIYIKNISLVSPTIPFYPTNNGHGIYFEDASIIGIGAYAGDGVSRGFTFNNYNNRFYPQMAGAAEITGDQVTVRFAPADLADPQRPVVSIRYKFDDGDWQEASGGTLTATIPDGAVLLYVTAKDSAGFYLYPPNEIDLAE